MVQLNDIAFGQISVDRSNGEAPIQTIYETSTSQAYRLGTKLTYADGRVFRYAVNGSSALVQAFMTQSSVLLSDFEATVQTGHAQVVGATDISVLVTTGTAAAENSLAGGTLLYNKVSPSVLGDIYHILASKLRAGDDTIMDLKIEAPGIRIIVGATGEATLTSNRWFGTIVVPTSTATSMVAGVPLVPVAASAFYWAQTGGMSPLMVDTSDTIVAGQPVGIPATSAVAGACDIRITALAQWGTCVSPAAAGGEPALVYLEIDS